MASLGDCDEVFVGLHAARAYIGHSRASDAVHSRRREKRGTRARPNRSQANLCGPRSWGGPWHRILGWDAHSRAAFRDVRMVTSKPVRLLFRLFMRNTRNIGMVERKNAIF